MNELTVLSDAEILHAETKLSVYNESTEQEIVSQTVGNFKDIALECSKIAKSLDAMRQDATKPALEEQRRVNAFYKPTIEKLDEFSKKLMDRVAKFVRDEARKESERKAIEAKANAEKLLAGKPIEAPVSAKPSEPIVTVSEKVTWEFEIIEEEKIPKKYLCPDEDAIRQAIKSGVRAISGIKIFEKTTVLRR